MAAGPSIIRRYAARSGRDAPVAEYVTVRPELAVATANISETGNWNAT